MSLRNVSVTCHYTTSLLLVTAVIGRYYYLDTATVDETELDELRPRTFYILNIFYLVRRRKYEYYIL